jgi:hypothetical protein
MVGLRNDSRRRIASPRALVAAGVVATALLSAVPAWASERGGVVVTGVTDTSLAKKIQSELAARGLDVATSSAAPDAAVRVRLDGDGRVTLETTEAPPETLALELDEDVLARKVAENVRARMLTSEKEKPSAVVGAAKPVLKDEPPEAAPAAPPPPASAIAPAGLLARRGAWLLSADDALPLVSVGSAAPFVPLNALRFGDPGGSIQPSPPRPIALDVAVLDHLTIGGAVIVEQTVTERNGSSIHEIGRAHV